MHPLLASIVLNRRGVRTCRPPPEAGVSEGAQARKLARTSSWPGMQHLISDLAFVKLGRKIGAPRWCVAEYMTMDVGYKILGYVIDRKIGEGGMGAVFHAVHPVLGQEVAIKVLDPVLARRQEARERFLQEARIQALLEHRNIVRVLTADVEGDEPALVMEYVDGLSLDRVLEKRGPLPLDDAIRLMEQVAAGVGYAHSLNVVHRDLKPGNVMVRADGTVKVTDFGIAKILGGARLTRTGTTVGSAHYMAPEQILGRTDIDHRADIYALGCTFYEVLTGRPPFGHLDQGTDADFGIKQGHVESPPPDPRSLRPDLPEPIALAILKALEKDAAGRPQSCEEFVRLWTEKPASAPSLPPPPLREEIQPDPEHRAVVPPVQTKRPRSGAWFGLLGVGLLVAAAAVVWNRGNGGDHESAHFGGSESGSAPPLAMDSAQGMCVSDSQCGTNEACVSGACVTDWWCCCYREKDSAGNVFEATGCRPGRQHCENLFQAAVRAGMKGTAKMLVDAVKPCGRFPGKHPADRLGARGSWVPSAFTKDPRGGWQLQGRCVLP